MQAVVPPNLAPNVEQQIIHGKVYTFCTFAVKDYHKDEVYKCINYDKFILLTEETKIQEFPDIEKSIQKNSFDFYRLEQLKNLAGIDIFLTGEYTNLFWFSAQLFCYNSDARLFSCRCYWNVACRRS